jgi:hypothetical protein
MFNGSANLTPARHVSVTPCHGSHSESVMSRTPRHTEARRERRNTEGLSVQTLVRFPTDLGAGFRYFPHPEIDATRWPRLRSGPAPKWWNW